MPERPTNCTFGSKDLKTLFVTANKNLYAIELKNPGVDYSRNNGTGIGTASVSTGIRDIVQVFPNPANKVLNICANLTSMQINLVNMHGKSVYKGSVNQGEATLTLPDLCSGLYLLKLEHNHEVYVQKVIVHQP
ncbi:MAG: T9SS type A sorting domain-containing protein [Bacteroidales bacterium]|nr:T9SS type A sorting domain-containing protein [Bacteroidales bacterium]